MNFMLINGRTPDHETFCGLCRQRIGNDGYLRDIRTQLCYCNTKCYGVHSGGVLPMVFGECVNAS